MKLLKADLHIHTSEDPKDYVRYSAFELIDMASAQGFEVLAITNHDTCTFNQYLKDYALERGIILLPGMEASIQRRHVLLINMPFADISINRLSDLRNLPRENTLIIAPHPFYPSLVALGKYFIKYIDCFDAAEWSHFYCTNINFNKKMVKVAQDAGLPIVGTSDAHQRCQFNRTYTLIESEFHPEAVIQAVKDGRVRLKTSPFPLPKLIEINAKMVFRNLILKHLDRNHHARPRGRNSNRATGSFSGSGSQLTRGHNHHVG